MKYLMFSLLALMFLVCPAQEYDMVTIGDGTSKEECFREPDEMPMFPGGEAALVNFLSQNINYPSDAIEKQIEGKVVLQFVVTRTGEIGEVKVVRPVDPDLDAEAVRVVKLLPNFAPGMVDGKPVNVWYTLPVSFKLQGEDVDAAVDETVDLHPSAKEIELSKKMGTLYGITLYKGLLRTMGGNVDSSYVSQKMRMHLDGFVEHPASSAAFDIASNALAVYFGKKKDGSMTIDTKAMFVEFESTLRDTVVRDEEQVAEQVEKELTAAVEKRDGLTASKKYGQMFALFFDKSQMSMDDYATVLGIMDYALTKLDLNNVNEVGACMGAIYNASCFMDAAQNQVYLDLDVMNAALASALASGETMDEEKEHQLKDEINQIIKEIEESK